MSSTTELVAWDLAHLWHPFTHHGLWGTADGGVFVIERAEGNVLIDTDGRRYIDAISSLWCNTLGHQVPAIDDAIRAQLDKVAHSTMLGLSNQPAIRLAKRLADLAPGDLDRVFYSDAGATAVEIALKIAVQYQRIEAPQRTKLLSIGEAYHGDTMGSVALGYSSWFHRHFDHLVFDVGKLSLDPEQACAAIAAAGDELAAVIVEPLVQGAAGMLMQPQGYLRAIADATRAAGGLLIADEVATGLWRTGRRFACDHEDVVPDIMCLAKGLSGGYLPVAATIVGPNVFAPFAQGGPDGSRTFFHGHTFTGNPLGCAASLAALDALEDLASAGRVAELIDRLTARLARLSGNERVREIRQRGLMVGVALNVDAVAQPRKGHEIAQYARSHGVLLRPLGTVMVLMPPFSMTDEQLDTVMDVLTAGIDAVL